MKKSYMLSVTCLGLLLVSGCAVLTKSQVKEVNAFAEVSKEYGTLPGEPIRTYGHILRSDRILSVATRNFSSDNAQDKAWSELEKANIRDETYDKVADEVDATLEVLDKYSTMLLTLSSDQFNDSLDASTKSLGESLNKAINQYNTIYCKPNGKDELGLIGGTVAAGIRGGAGIWLRNRQAKYLKESVTAAQPVVTNLTTRIQDLMTNILTGYLNDLETRYQEHFSAWLARNEKIPYETAESVADVRRQISQGRELCASAAKAAQRFAEAHTKLKENLMNRQTLKARIEEITRMADEIKKAQKIQKLLKQP